jgi:hypothetical protein
VSAHVVISQDGRRPSNLVEQDGSICAYCGVVELEYEPFSFAGYQVADQLRETGRPRRLLVRVPAGVVDRDRGPQFDDRVDDSMSASIALAGE